MDGKVDAPHERGDPDSENRLAPPADEVGKAAEHSLHLPILSQQDSNEKDVDVTREPSVSVGGFARP
jgi:hypothetical protein